MEQLRVAILGYGGISRSHHHAYRLLAEEGFPVRLCALCDIDPAQFDQTVSINLGESAQTASDGLHLYTSLEDMLAAEKPDVVDVCLPTYLHKEYVLRLLRAGVHVQCEKPMALSAADCDEMIRAADQAGRYLMIGQCLRFSADYLALKELLDSGRIGRPLTMRMERLSSLPRWGFEGWYHDVNRSGGCMLDLAIHDFDMARFLFGEPEKVSAIARDGITPQQWSDSRLFFPDGLVVSVNASWNESASFPFTCTFRLTAEHATVLWDGQHPLRVFPDTGEPYTLTYPARDYMAEEIRFLATCILKNCQNHKNPPSSARNTVLLANTLRESAARGGEVLRFSPD